MLSVQQPSSTKSSIGHAEHSPHRPSPLGTLSPPPSPRQSANVGNYPSSPRTGVPGMCAALPVSIRRPNHSFNLQVKASISGSKNYRNMKRPWYVRMHFHLVHSLIRVIPGSDGYGFGGS